jgi:hypothetical protein
MQAPELRLVAAGEGKAAEIVPKNDAGRLFSHDK